MKTSLTETSDLSTPSSNLNPIPVWSPWSTVFWALFIFFIFGLAQGIGALVAAVQYGVMDEVMAAFGSGNQEAQEQMLYAHDLAWPAAFASALLGSLAIFFVIAIKKGLSIKEYLHLKRAPLHAWGLWLLIILVMMGLSEWLAADNEALQTSFMMDVVSGTKSLPMLILTVGVLAPIFEELLFRGFIFKGLERGLLGGHGAVWLSSIVFAAIHLQYPLPIVLMIIPMGLLLGYSRMYSGSLWVPIVLHVLNNTVAIGLTAYQIHEGISF